LEGIAHNLRWSIDNLEKDFNFKISSLKITGGGSVNKVWMQIIADITERNIQTTSQPLNAGAMGAAVVAMVGDGALKSFDEITKLIQITDTFYSRKEFSKLYQEGHQTYRAVYHNLAQTYQTINKKRFE
jgi:xylulokinase